MRFRIFGRILSFLVSVIAIAVVALIARQLPENTPEPLDPLFYRMTETGIASLSPSPMNSPRPTSNRTLKPNERASPSATPSIALTKIKSPTATPSPAATKTFLPTSQSTPTPKPSITPTPAIIRSGYEEVCEDMIYKGIQRCIKGPYQVVRIDPKNPYVRFETVLPLGYDRNGEYGECRDVYLPDSVQPGQSTGSGCFNDHSYPGERVGFMASRYPGAVVAFNGDFFSPSYAWGPMGLTVKNGTRLDGGENDQEGMEVRRSSLSISRNGEVRIGPIPLESLPDPGKPWVWKPDPDDFYNTIGGLPLLVKNGHPVDLHTQCMQEQGWCPDQYYQRARTAFGKTFDGQVIVVIVPEEWGLTIEQLAHLMVELGSMEAINLDGGGSSQLWYAGSYLYYSSRPVAEGMIVFSELINGTGGDSRINQ